MNLQEAIAKTNENEGGTCEFNWNESNHTWCLSGLTVDHLVWETDDFKASDKEQAELDAANYLIEYNDL